MYLMVDKEMGEIYTNNSEIECYICTGNDPIPWKSDCNCTDRYVHSECQIELIDKTGSLKCPVCLIDYKNINPTYYRKFYINSKAVWTFIVCLLSLTVSVCAIVLLISYEKKERNKNSAVGFAGGVFVGFSSICFILVALFIKSEGGFKKLYLDCYVPHIKLEINEPNLCA
ncbi:MAG: hypothetical protein CMB31_01415 [Euryarchaeota archaeon]|nr:hypothetical protein [Euryarchaeota archaeon]